MRCASSGQRRKLEKETEKREDRRNRKEKEGTSAMEINGSSSSCSSPSNGPLLMSPQAAAAQPAPLSRYESQKLRDWNTFGQYLKNHRPPLTLGRCSGAHVLEFLRYLDQFGKTKVHSFSCPFFGQPCPPAPCPCPLRQAWGSLDALIGRLRAAYDEHGGGTPDTNPFAARAVRLYLREVRELQSKARGVCYDKKKRPANKLLRSSAAAADFQPAGADCSHTGADFFSI